MFENPGGLNGSTQHWLKSSNRSLKSYSTSGFKYGRKTLSCLGLIDYSSERSVPCEKCCPINRLDGVASTG
jgi:hypothetical protein